MTNTKYSFISIYKIQVTSVPSCLIASLSRSPALSFLLSLSHFETIWSGREDWLHTLPWQRSLNDGNKRDLKIPFESVWARDGVWNHSSIDSSVLPSNLLPSHFSLYLFISVCTLPLFRQPIMRLNRHLIEQVGLLCLVTTRKKSNLTP